MSKLSILAPVRLSGPNAQIENLEIEEIAGDPTELPVGRIWINTVEHKLKYVSHLNELNEPVVQTIVVIQDLAALQGLISAHAVNHVPGGTDSLPTAPAVTLSPNSTNTEGESSALSRADHTHEISEFQPLSNQLTAFAQLESFGILKRSENGTLVFQSLSASEIPNLDWSKIVTGKPTTKEGYGITNAVGTEDLQVVQDTFEDGAAGNGFVSQSDTDVSFNNSTRTFTISPSGSEYHFYVKGKRFTRTESLTVTIGNTSGLWFIYFDSTGSIQSSMTPWNLFITAPICIIYWNSDLAAAQFIGEERHMCIMDAATHEYMHHTQGTRYRGGLVAGDYTLIGSGNSNADVQLSISDGYIQDEDIIISIKHAVSPSAKFEQVLTLPAQLPVMYRSGASWVKDTATAYPVKLDTNRIVYNKVESGSWVTQEASEGKFVAMYVVATNAMSNPVVSLMGQRQDDTLDDARQNNDFAQLTWGDMPFSEFKALYRVIYQTSSTYTNAVHAKIVQIDDLRNVITQTISAIPTANHDALTGLSADDHPQYIHLSVPRLITAQHQYAPTTQQAPFTLGVNALGQLVEGLNSNYLNGIPSSGFQSASAQLSNIAALVSSGILRRSSEGEWSLSNLTSSDIPNLDWSKITTGKPTTAEGYGITDIILSNVGTVYSGSIPVMSGTNTTIPVNNNTPSDATGALLFQRTIVPKNTNFDFIVDFKGMVDTGNKDRGVVITLFRKIGAGNWIFLGYTVNWFSSANSPSSIALLIKDSPDTTEAVTYMARIGLNNNGSWYLGRTRDDTMGGVNPSTYTITEVKQ